MIQVSDEDQRDALTRGARGGAVTLAGQGAKLCIQLLSIVVLSRILAPSDFGIVAMATVFVALGNLLRDSGMPIAALQSRTLTNQQASNLFWLNTLLGLAGALLLGLATPLIVSLYGEPELAGIIPMVATTLVLSGVQAQLQVQLSRSMRFTPLVVTDIASQMIGVGAAVLTALGGLGYWALVVQLVVASGTLLVLRWCVARWVPLRPRRGHDSARLIVTGSHFGATQVLTYVATNIDTVVIGTRWGSGALGYYSRAFDLLLAPIAGMLGPLTNVAVPTLNSAASRSARLESLLLRLQFAIGMALVWVFGTTAAIAPVLIPLALGPGWEPTIAIFQILAIGGSFQVFSYISYWSFIVNDQSKQLLYYNVATKTLTIAMVIVASYFGPIFVAMAYSAALIVSWPINLLWLARCAGQHSSAFLRSGLRLLIAGAASFAAAAAALGVLATLPAIALVAIGITVSAAVFTLGLIVLPGGIRMIRDSIGALMALLKQRR